MGQRKWFPTQSEKEIVTKNYRYVIGVYRHEKYGENNLRVTKYKLDGTYVGHFVLVNGDQHIIEEMLNVRESN